ncbi:inositol hexakisphosphate and diphosphoinositol-pentakisphosphate kinase [Metarhizium acridum]|nr:inositol hexakisphosphate and diphosphoinositol-pentakisphosphate kinase [Metarhizium acridum]
MAEHSISRDDPSSPRSSISSAEREIPPGPSTTTNIGQGQPCPSGPSLHGQQLEPQHQHQERRPTASPSPSPARSHSRKISASSIAASIAGKRSRYVDSVPSETNSEPSSFPFASQSTPIPVKVAHSPSWHSRSQSGISDAGSDVLVFGEAHPSSPTHSDILRIRAGLNAENAAHVWLPEPSLTARSSLSDLQSRRLSSTSIYSLASARGITNYSSSAHGSDS